MAINTTLAGLSQTASSNGPDGSVDAPSLYDDAVRYLGSFIATLRDGKGFTNAAQLVCAATLDIGAQDSMFVEVSGNTGPITSLGTTYNGPRIVRFASTPTMNHNSSSLILPTAANITFAANDCAIFIPKTTAGTADGWACVAVQRASGGALVLADGSVTTAKIVDANVTAAKLDGAQSGSAPIFGVRAWVRFNGTGTVAINGSGNVSSITDNGTGDYTVNFTTAMSDANYAINVSASSAGAAVSAPVGANFRTGAGTLSPPAAGSSRFTLCAGGTNYDCDYVFVQVVR